MSPSEAVAKLEALLRWPNGAASMIDYAKVKGVITLRIHVPEGVYCNPPKEYQGYPVTVVHADYQAQT